ncbi:MAG: hypothetical protein PVJ63_09615 [Thioalkalispiraceae bacterium]|jgi:hypothetical protein
MAVPVLNIPSQELKKRPKPYLKVRQLERWLSELPTANTARATQQLLEQLKTINRSRYPAHERIRLLDTLRPTTRQLLIQLKQPLKNSKLPLDRKQKNAAQTIQKILEEMAAGYKSVVSQLILRNSRKESDEMLLREAIYNSIQYLARRLVESYLIYAPEPYDAWRELHQLYNYAEQSGIHNLPVDDPYPDYMLPVAYTIELVYKRILLLSLSAPYHLMQNEAEELYHLLSSWCHECHIYPAIGQDIENEFVFDLASDSAPRYLPPEMDWQPTNGRILDIKSVCLRLDNFLQQFLTQDNIDDTHSLVEIQQRDMLLRLAQALEENLSRQSERQTAGNNVQIAVGINAAHYFLSQQVPFSPEMDELKLRGQHDLEPSMFAMAYKKALEKDRRHGHKHYNTYSWKQNNTSDTGSALNCSLDNDEQAVKVGELVAYHSEKSSSNRWKIGLIRWVKFQTDFGVDMGVMNLSHTAVPVAIKAISGIGKGTDYFRGLMIPKQVSIQQTRSLVVPATLYDVNTVLAINMKNRFFYIKLSRQILSTRSFTQYEFEVLQD